MINNFEEYAKKMAEMEDSLKQIKTVRQQLNILASKLPDGKFSNIVKEVADEADRAMKNPNKKNNLDSFLQRTQDLINGN